MSVDIIGEDLEVAVSAACVGKGMDVVEGHEFGGGPSGLAGSAKALGFECGDEGFGHGVVVGLPWRRLMLGVIRQAPKQLLKAARA